MKACIFSSVFMALNLSLDLFSLFFIHSVGWYPFEYFKTVETVLGCFYSRQKFLFFFFKIETWKKKIIATIHKFPLLCGSGISACHFTKISVLHVCFLLSQASRTNTVLLWDENEVIFVQIAVIFSANFCFFSSRINNCFMFLFNRGGF